MRGVARRPARPRRGASGGTTGLGEGNVLAARQGAGPGARPRASLGLARLRRARGAARRGGADPAQGRARRPPGRATPGPPSRPAWRALGVAGAELVDAAELRRLEPRADRRGARRHATSRATSSAIRGRSPAPSPREAEAAGAEVRTGVARARRSRSPRGAASRARTTADALAAGAVVLAAGPWTRAARRRPRALPLPLEPRKGQLVRLRAPQPAGFVRHKVSTAAYLPRSRAPTPGCRSPTVVETTSDGDVLVGSSRERRGFDTTRGPRRARRHVERAARLFPALRGAAACYAAWAGLRPWLPDHLPAIGPSGAVPGLWLATGPRGRRRRARPGHRPAGRAAVTAASRRSSTPRRSAGPLRRPASARSRNWCFRPRRRPVAPPRPVGSRRPRLTAPGIPFAAAGVLSPMPRRQPAVPRDGARRCTGRPAPPVIARARRRVHRYRSAASSGWSALRHEHHAARGVELRPPRAAARPRDR